MLAGCFAGSLAAGSDLSTCSEESFLSSVSCGPSGNPSSSDSSCGLLNIRTDATAKTETNSPGRYEGCRTGPNMCRTSRGHPSVWPVSKPFIFHSSPSKARGRRSAPSHLTTHFRLPSVSLGDIPPRSHRLDIGARNFNGSPDLLAVNAGDNKLESILQNSLWLLPRTTNCYDFLS